MALDTSLIGKPTAPAPFEYTSKDTMLYALGVGAKRDELDFVYEGRGPKVLPSFAVVPKFAPMLELLSRTGADLSMLVYSAERVILHEPFPPAGRMLTTATVRGYYDLRKLAQIVIDMRTEDASGRLIAETTSAMLVRGAGGFGGEPPAKEPPLVEKPKDLPPTFAVEEATLPEQALIYRLSGDRNPLHADPDFARAVGFEQGPILHGLCTFGFMLRHAAKAACGGEPMRIRSFEAQFRRPVWPGETLVTEGWQTGPGEVALQVRVKGRDEPVITNAGMIIRT